jgi:dTDP-4-dehydrorhamnose reductase
VTKVLEWARRNKELSIVCDQIGKPTYSPDLAKALLELVARMLNDTDKPQGLLHLAGYDAMSRFEQAQAILSISQARNGVYATVKPVLTRDFPTPATRPLNAVLDCTRAYERYGITLSDFKTGLAATLDAIL